MTGSDPIKGRGAASNPANRFEALHLESDSDGNAPCSAKTVFFRDQSASILSFNNSPDVGFDAAVNPFRGCEHGCIYCYARPLHEYLGFSSGLDFETRIMVKEDVDKLLRRELSSSKWVPQVISFSSATDCYQPVERRLLLTRRCLQVAAEFRNPICITTKSHLVTRDIDVISEMASFNAAAVCISITSLIPELARKLEPRASLPSQRLKAVESLSKAGIPVGVLVAPVIPALTDHEMINIISMAAQAGASFVSYEVLRLPYAVKDLFLEWLQIHEPLKKEKILSGIQTIRGGKLNDSDFRTRMRGEGKLADQIEQIFHIACHKAGIKNNFPSLSTSHFRRPGGTQMDLHLQ